MSDELTETEAEILSKIPRCSHGLLQTRCQKCYEAGVKIDKTEFTKFDGEKPRLALWPPKAFVAVGEVLTLGAAKYSDENWKKVDDPRRYFSAALRHIFARLEGEANDQDDDKTHLAHAICCLAFLLDLELDGVDITPWINQDST
jgi:hypothetical protein